MYDQTAKGYDRLHREEQEKKLRIISDNIEVEPEDRLLDIGCGTGFASRFFNCRYFGIDPSEEMIGMAVQKHAQESSEKKDDPLGEMFRVGSAESLPFPDNRFDVVISVTAMHNFKDMDKALEEIRRVGKKGCRYAFSVLKRSVNLIRISAGIRQGFEVQKTVQEEKDLILFCR
ncbi:methyltransferase domain-containing protein [Candidatus Woesearchaeota archaeon]|nr:methyltransferase domain-containing protein [Candidatus Woesearchaeota archaeon]